MVDIREKYISALVDMIKEDRIEVRDIRKRIINLNQLFLVASFVIGSFLIKDVVKDLEKHYEIILLSAIFPLIFFVINKKLFKSFKLDLSNCRICLEGREELLEEEINTEIKEGEKRKYEIFKDFRFIEKSDKNCEIKINKDDKKEEKQKNADTLESKTIDVQNKNSKSDNNTERKPKINDTDLNKIEEFSSYIYYIQIGFFIVLYLILSPNPFSFLSKIF